MKTAYMIGALLLVIGGGVYSLSGSSKDGAVVMQNDAMIATDTAMMQKEATNTMMQKNNAMMGEKDVTVTLSALNGSREHGTATLSAVDGKTRVVINISGSAVGVTQPAHIHLGSCPTPGAVKYPLTSVMNGSSETILDVPLSKILSELPLAINVHKSATDIKTFVACGNIYEGDAVMNKTNTTMMQKTATDTMMQKSADAMMGTELK